MILIIDYHSEQSAAEIEPEDWLALIVARLPGRRAQVRAGWKHLLDLEFAADAANDHKRSFGEQHALAISSFVSALVRDARSYAVAVRCDQGRDHAASIAKALGASVHRHVPEFAGYNRRIYDLVRGALTPEPRAARRAALAERIQSHLRMDRPQSG